MNKDINKDIVNFCEEHNITENQYYGVDEIKNNLYLDNVTELVEGFNPTVGGYLYLNGVTELIEGFNPTVGGELYLSNVTKLVKGFNPTVGGYLNLGSITELIEGFNPTVGRSLYLGSITKLIKGFNPTVGGSLYLGSITKLIKEFNPTVGGSLHLNGVTKLIKGFNPIVTGNLYLNTVTKLIKGFNPTVTGNLYLPNITKLIAGFNPTVGGYLYLKNDTIQNSIKPKKLLEWNNGKYISVDGIFCEVITKKTNLFYCKKINKEEYFYIVTNGDVYSHGLTIKEARADLIYKIGNRDKSEYNNLTIDSILSFEEIIKCYMVITGACSYGTKNFVTNHEAEVKDNYSIKEIIKITKNQFGNEEFKKFFEKS